MMKSRTLAGRALTVLAAAAALAAGGAARADALATSLLQVTGFQIQDPATGVARDFTNFNFPNGLNSIVDNGTNTASLSGFAPIAPIVGSVTGGGALDIAQACVGVVCPGANSFVKTLPPPGNHLARADSKLDGAPITGIPGNLEPLGANARTVAEVQLTSSAIGSGDSDLGLNTTFGFFLLNPIALRFDFDADLYLRTFLSADILSGLSQASSSLVFTIDQRNANGTATRIFEWAPNGAAGGITGGTENQDPFSLTQNLSALTGGENFSLDQQGHFQADTALLPAGVNLILGIRHVTNADAQQQEIPEPMSLLLAGAGLLGMGAARRLRKQC